MHDEIIEYTVAFDIDRLIIDEAEDQGEKGEYQDTNSVPNDEIESVADSSTLMFLLNGKRYK